MNGAAACHEIAGCPGLYVDAFKGKYLEKTKDAQNAFILSHYHGDHYGSLPREGKYQGPALIHCTPVTAALLKTVHQVPAQFVVEHGYGESWTYRMKSKEKKEEHSAVKAPDNQHQDQVQITFYDANHCPGAAIVAIQFADETVHLHTGDMRYHEKMKTYPVIRKAVANRKLDIVYLDTTYGHPKHDFVAQGVAVNTIASHVHELLGNERIQSTNDSSRARPKILVLLSCYSIGKEKVLWETANRTNQLVYVTERKLQMMQCIQSPANKKTEGEQGTPSCPCSQMIQKCTRDPNATDIHVIRMGLAGELWPFFRPNYQNCVDYAEDLSQHYDKVVAFIPTGWANASNWNKKNAVSTRQMECRKTKRFMDVEIRLISYSEHSAFSELTEFAEYLKPRKVVPTVFSDEKDCQRIEKLFRKYIDSSRAKLQFFKSMQGAATSTKPAFKSLARTARSQKQDPVKRDGETKKEDDSGLIDLTFSSSDEEDSNKIKENHSSRSTGQSSLRNPRKSKVSAEHSELSTQSYKRRLSSTAQVGGKTPTKRKSESSSSKAATPPITSFFSAKPER